MIYMISYDLKSPTSNREQVEQNIKSLGPWCKYVSTTYLVKSALPINDVQDIVTANLDNNDRMLICKTEKPIAGFLESNQWDWIEQNL